MSDQQAGVAHVEGTIVYADGERVDFLLGKDGTSRWGNTTQMLGRAVDPCDVMVTALRAAEAFDNGATDPDDGPRRTITSEQYDAVCEVIDRAKMDDRSLDTDQYAGMVLDALGGVDIEPRTRIAEVQAIVHVLVDSGHDAVAAKVLEEAKSADPEAWRRVLAEQGEVVPGWFGNDPVRTLAESSESSEAENGDHTMGDNQ